nr:RICIN domain-containing protein [Saccharothrix ecbatanensis]
MVASGLEAGYRGLLAKINLAYAKTTSTSSDYSTSFGSAKAIDNNASTGWSPTGSDTSPWWQVDLGAPYALGQFSLTTRHEQDQPETRSSFEVRGSNDPDFAGYVVLGRQDSATLPYGATLTGKIDVRQKFRYVRVAKTDSAYFYITELSVQQAGGALEGSATTPDFNPSTYYTIKNVNSGLLADVHDSSTADGAAAVQRAANNGLAQQWSVVRVSGNLYKIVNRNSGKALDVNSGSHTKGTKLIQWTYHGGNNQLWYFEPTSAGYVIRNFETRQAAETSAGSTADGAGLAQWAALNQPHQLWTIQ